MKKVVIIGGGSAGWLTALYLQKTWPNLVITVLEDPDTPPIIAGESSTTTFVDLLKYLDIMLEDWIVKTQATPKMGGHFKNWNGIGTEFIHPLQTDVIPGYDLSTELKLDNILTLGDWMQTSKTESARSNYIKSIIADDIKMDELFFSGEFIRQNKVPYMTTGTTKFPIDCMWHYESRNCAAYFKKIGLERNISLIEEKYKLCKRDNQGNITSIILENGRSIDTDWIFDCSGFARLILGKEMQEPLVDFTNFFPARSVIAWWDQPIYQVTTNATAMEYGWSWNINLQHRSGNGYIYDPDLITEDQALAEITKTFGDITPVAKVRFNPGMMKSAWINNVIGIGLSTGFMEPLEANGIAVIIRGLTALSEMWDPFDTYSNRDRYNNTVWNFMINIRDFISLHYRGNRRDTEFWQSHANDKERIPDSLTEKLHLWKEFYLNLRDLPIMDAYSSTAWVTVLQGISKFPTDNLKKSYNSQKTLNKSLRLEFQEQLSNCWTVDRWVHKFTNTAQ